MINRENLIAFHIKYADWFARIAIFIVYFWFGALKLFGASPAADFVTSLQEITLPFIPSEAFLILLGIVEIVIGTLFLFPKITKISSLIFFAHMITTFLPFIFLPEAVSDSFLKLTLEGQYVVKNVVLIALVFTILGTKLEKEVNNQEVELPERAPQLS